MRNVLIAAIAVTLAGCALEQPAFTTVDRFGQIEIRAYEPQLVAAKYVDAGFEEAGNAAFGPLFDYISGENEAEREIEMTAPVTQVTRGDRHAVSFFIPAAVAAEGAPAPVAEDVAIEARPASTVAVLRYSGRWTEARFRLHEAKLRTALDGSAWRVCGDPLWARYDPPFLPAFLRLNEVQVPVARGTCGG